ncbi:MAG: hypothetical protein COB15_05340 [Flavobacteriales bacterium]|nr:MAG: hypothetical protein COB15_05340 [Flavobacteriales bacterium]
MEVLVRKKLESNFHISKYRIKRGTHSIIMNEESQVFKIYCDKDVYNKINFFDIKEEWSKAKNISFKVLCHKKDSLFLSKLID